jgi:hypothetical protein
LGKYSVVTASHNALRRQLAIIFENEEPRSRVTRLSRDGRPSISALLFVLLLSVTISGSPIFMIENETDNREVRRA